MRSSIACSRCRRSKIKCLNSGTNTQCRACATAGRECTYPPPAQGPTAAKRTGGPGAIRNDGETEVKRQRKRESDAGRKNSLKHGDDPFEQPQITARLWKEVYSAFMLHCSTELPFLHEEVFHTRVQQPAAERSPDTQLFLLAMLALTARFIPEIAQNHHSTDPLVASEYYADAFAARLNAQGLTKEPTLERVQGLLMISLYQWLMCRGQVAWMYITIAKGFAQTMGLMFEEDVRPTKKPRAASLLEEARQLGVRSKLPDSGPRSDEQSLIQREVKRRTAYSCFILDRYQASGRCRPQNVSIEDLHVQLPCSEEDFQFGINVTTSTLMEQLTSPSSAEGSRAVASTQVLSIFIQLCEIWGRVSRWSSKGGRRNEQHAPFEPYSEFHRLWSQVQEFSRNLPPKLRFGSRNISAHIAGQTITLYTSIQTLLSLCTIVLHREYLPFIPLRCSKPEGPLDEPTFPPGSAPQGFWEESAKHIFKSAREIMEIVRITSDRQVLVESPQVGFAIWTAAFAGIYAINFPHMDQDNYMCGDRPTGQEEVDPGTELSTGATALAIRTLKDMTKRSKMACGWAGWSERIHGYFKGIKHDYDQAIRSVKGPAADHQKRVNDARERSLREGGYGGGLEEYKLLEIELKNFGPCLESDRYNSPTPFSRGSTRPPTVKVETATANGDNGWAAVNVAPTLPSTGGRLEELASFAGQSPADPRNTGTYYARMSPSNPPSLLASSTPRSTTVDVQSPYQNSHPTAATYSNTSYAQGSQASYSHQVQPPAHAMHQQQQQSQDQAFKQLEQINMQGVDVAMFGGSLDGNYFPADDWQAVVGPTGQGGGMNFMEAAARPPSGPYGPFAQG